MGRVIAKADRNASHSVARLLSRKGAVGDSIQIKDDATANNGNQRSSCSEYSNA